GRTTWVPLPSEASTDDLKAVAKKLLAGSGQSAVIYAAGYAMRTRRFMPALVDLIDWARDTASLDGRTVVTIEDLKHAEAVYCAPSDELKEQAEATKLKARAPGRANAAPAQRSGIATAAPLQRPTRANDFGSYELPVSD